MEKIIFFGLVIPIFAFVLYLGVNAIMKGFSAKNANKSNNDEQDVVQNFSNENENLSDELNRLNQLYQDGVLTKEEFDKAKEKILDK
tara:strand:- start:286 stop:546 length:261 start_codon:yes stop_codon:yes gene_type:complete